MRNIGIFYNDLEWARKVFSDILHEIPQNAIVRYSNQFLQISFTDGSRLTFVKPNDSARGHKFSEVYIQDGISIDAYRERICFCINPMKKVTAYVIRNAEDIFYHYKTAKEYYLT